MGRFHACLVWAGRWSEMFIGVAAFVFLAAGTAFNTHALTYDEPHRIEVVHMLSEKGLTREFLEQMPHATGPLTPVLQLALAPLTRLDVPGLRLTNVMLLAFLIAVTASTLRRSGHVAPWTASLAIMGLPTTWVVAGLALTEMPAMLCVACAIAMFQFMFKAQSDGARTAFAAMAGGWLALASLGRQPYLLLVFMLPFLAWERREHLGSVAICITCAVVPPFAVFGVWRGLVPPAVQTLQGFSFAHGVLAFAYAGAFTIIYAPRWLRWEKFMLGAIAIVVLLVAAFDRVNILPLESITRRVLSPGLVPIWTRLISSAFAGMALWFVGSLFLNGWRRRGDTLTVFLTGGVLLTLGACFDVTGNFSSRYVAMAFPLLVPLLAVDRLLANRWSSARTAMGCVIGAVQLWSYFWLPEGS